MLACACPLPVTSLPEQQAEEAVGRQGAVGVRGEGISDAKHPSFSSPISPHKQPSSADLLEPSDTKSEADVADNVVVLGTVSTCLAFQVPDPAVWLSPSLGRWPVAEQCLNREDCHRVYRRCD